MDQKGYTKKILVIITTGFVPWGGLTTVMMNYYRAMDKTGLSIDFASDNEVPRGLVDEIEQNESCYIRLPSRKKHTVKYMFVLRRVLKEGRYHVVHIHGNSATVFIELFPAWLAKTKKRIVHVHTTRNSHAVAHQIMKPLMEFFLTDRVAVSEEAGQYLYGKRYFVILNNAIDVEHYRFCQEDRISCRKKWEIPDSTFVVGTVGKINIPKNQRFLVEVFAKVLEKRSDAKLLIVGDGELRKDLEEQIRMLGITDCCILTGMQEETAPFLSMMDVFVFPSIYEGFGMAMLEAQACGLRSLCSDTVPQSAQVTELCVSRPLGDREDWADIICGFGVSDNRDKLSEKAIKQIKKDFDIGTQAYKLRKIYTN